MKKRRFGEEPTIGVLNEQQAGLPVAEFCRRHGIGEAAFHTWRSRFGGKEVPDARRSKALGAKNRTLEKFPPETMRDAATLREALGRQRPTRGAPRTAVS